MARTKSISFPNTEGELSNLFDNLQRAATNRNLIAGGISIKGNSASPTASFADDLYYLADGLPKKKSKTDCAALSGTVTNAKFNVFVFTVTAGGTLATRMGTEASTFNGITLPTIPDGEIVYGMVVINPTGTGNFVGGTTNLDDGTVVPNAVFIDIAGGFAPYCNPL